MNNYKYSDLTTMFLPEKDWIHLAHEGGRKTMVEDDQADEKSPQPIAMRTLSRVAKSMKHIALMKIIQEAARAKRIQCDADVAAGRPLSPILFVYVTTAHLKKVAAARKSWQRWDLSRCLRSNLLAQLVYTCLTRDELHDPIIFVDFVTSRSIWRQVV
jgi:hypothetical protein